MNENVEVITYTTPDDRYILSLEIDWENRMVTNTDWEEVELTEPDA